MSYPSRRTPNHHRTGIIGQDYPIDPYKRGELTDDPYNRYWTEESMRISAGSRRVSNPPREENPAPLYTVEVDGDPVLFTHLRGTAMGQFHKHKSAARGRVTLKVDGAVLDSSQGFGGHLRAANPRRGYRD